MITFKNKQFKNELIPSMPFMIVFVVANKNNSENSLEECIDYCELKPLSK